VLVAVAITALRWWRPVLTDDRPVRRCMIAVPVIMVVAILLATDRGLGFTLLLLLAGGRRGGLLLLPRPAAHRRVAGAGLLHGLWDFSLVSSAVVPGRAYVGPGASVAALVVLAVLVLVRRRRIEV
jgi:hypothetical protein